MQAKVHLAGATGVQHFCFQFPYDSSALTSYETEFVDAHEDEKEFKIKTVREKGKFELSKVPSSVVMAMVKANDFQYIAVPPADFEQKAWKKVDEVDDDVDDTKSVYFPGGDYGEIARMEDFDDEEVSDEGEEEMDTEQLKLLQKQVECLVSGATEALETMNTDSLQSICNNFATPTEEVVYELNMPNLNK